MPNIWTDGKCQRNHDITDPDNVLLSTVNGVTKRRCRQCGIDRALANRRGERLAKGLNIAGIKFEPRECEYCHKRYEYDPNRRVTINSWRQRKFCTRACKDANSRMRYEKYSGAIPKPLDDVTLARLRKMVGYTDEFTDERETG